MPYKTSTFTYDGGLDPQGRPSGSGTIQFDNGDVIECTWDHGMAMGKGKAKGKIDKIAAETFKKNLPKNTSLSVQIGEFSYEGEWKEGKMHGKGLFTYPNGDIYDGEWENNMANGTGMYKWEKGDIYQGQWKDMKRNGNGMYCLKDGSKYEGEWKDDKRHGKGIESYGSSARYEGYWYNDKLHGTGHLYVSPFFGGKEKRKSVVRSSTSSHKENGGSSRGPTIYRITYEHGKQTDKQKLESAPSSFPEPPKELRSRAEATIDDLDQSKDKIEEDNAFVDLIMSCSDGHWKTMEDLFVKQYKMEAELRNMKDIRSKLSIYCGNGDKIKNIEQKIEILEKVLSCGKDDMLDALKKVAESGDDDIPAPDTNDDIMKMKVEVKLQKLSEDLEVFKNEFSSIELPENIKHSDANQILELCESKIVELEKNIFRHQSTVATAKLHASSTSIELDTDTIGYMKAREIVVMQLTRLRYVIQNLCFSDSDFSNDKEQSEFKIEILSRMHSRFQRSINKFSNEINEAKAHPPTLLNRNLSLTAHIEREPVTTFP